MENSKAGGDEAKTTINENPSNINSSTSISVVAGGGGGSNVMMVNENDNQILQSSTTRTPFTNLSQIDADLALARTLQEQERAYMMLRMNGDGGEYGSWEAGSYVQEDDEDFDDPSEDEYDGSDADNDESDADDEEEDADDEEDAALDMHAHDESGEDNDPDVDLDPAAFPTDEAYARALQDAEDREMAARLLALAGINNMVAGEAEETEDHDGNSQDNTWEELDPDELSYEELLALGEVVGSESRGLSADTIGALPKTNYKTQSSQDGGNDSCVICRLDYEDGDTLTLLSCKHSYHSECINNWLQINKVCPVCSAEVPGSGNS